MISTGNKPCITVTCDDCGEDCWENQDGTPHFESVAEARRYVGDDWLWTDDEQVCRDCWAKRVCAAEGHDWGGWRTSARDEMEAFRLCDRCTAFDFTVAVGGQP